ncbi:MAG: hypothetical protein HQL37_11715 [Alphaproteobacteria bacterium]|nr:hypothetical protein [Alphaproteobacteria bacterium]
MTALGHRKGVYFYLDGTGQFRDLSEKDHAQAVLDGLFSDHAEWVRDHFSEDQKNGDQSDIRYAPLRRALMAACVRKGFFDPMERLRGRGAWLGDDGQLILHRGDAVLVGSDWYKPGVIGSHLYLGDAPLPPPAKDPQAAGKAGPAGELMEMLGTWQFQRGDVDTRLVLGWIASAMVGGALHWRPSIWVTGGRGSGKSTLHRLLTATMAGGAIAVSDATEAGLRQSLGHDSLPVMVDELEAGEKLEAVAGVIRFARISASGGELVRGGVDHKATRFVARSCFMFSSIKVPSLAPQDKSRIVVVRLGDLHGSAPPTTDGRALADLGARLLRRIVDQWQRFPQALEAYRYALMAEGASARTADVQGTLLAMADLLLNDLAVDTDSAQEAALSILSATDHADDEGSDEEQCLSHLLSTAIPLGHPTRKPIADYIADAADENIDANVALSHHGMRVIRDKARVQVLAVANSHDGLRNIFDGTEWGSRPGATGVWVQSLRRLPGAVTPGDCKVRIGQGRSAKPQRVTLIPLSLILDGKALGQRSTFDLAPSENAP